MTLSAPGRAVRAVAAFRTGPVTRPGMVADAVTVVAAAAEALATRAWLADWMFAGALVVAALLAVRRRFPRTVAVAAFFPLATGVLWIAALGALHALAATPRRRAEVAVGAVAVAVVSFVPWRYLDTYVWSARDVTLGVLLSVLLASAPTALGLLGRARAELAQRVAQLALAQDRERRHAAEQAALRERERLARDVHDTAAHHLSLISLQATALAAAAESPRAREAADRLGELSRAAARELRRSIRDLDPAGPAAAPGLADLPRLVAEAGDGVRAVLAVPETAGCPAEVQHTAYRVVQEALANVRRHAPGAPTRVTVELAPGGNDLLAVVHNGPPPVHHPAGPDDGRGGQGLPGLRARAATVGGTLHAAPDADGGFLVRAALPLTRPSPSATGRAVNEP